MYSVFLKHLLSCNEMCVLHGKTPIVGTLTVTRVRKIEEAKVYIL